MLYKNKIMMILIGILLIIFGFFIIKNIYGELIHAKCKLWALKSGVNGTLSDFKFYRSWFGDVWIKVERHDKKSGLIQTYWTHARGLLPTEKALQIEYYEDSKFIKKIQDQQKDVYKNEMGINVEDYKIKID